MKKLYQGYWNIKHINKKGEVKWEIVNKHNSLVNEGERLTLVSFYRDEDAPTAFYLRLCNDYLVSSDTLNDIQNEPVGNGYTPQLVERSIVGFPTCELHDGDFKLTSKQVSFKAVDGSIGPINTAFIATSPDNSGKLIAFVLLDSVRTVQSGDSLLVAMSAKQK